MYNLFYYTKAESTGEDMLNVGVNVGLGKPITDKPILGWVPQIAKYNE